MNRPQPRYNQHSACWPSRSAAWNECDPRGTAVRAGDANGGNAGAAKEGRDHGLEIQIE